MAITYSETMVFDLPTIIPLLIFLAAGTVVILVICFKFKTVQNRSPDQRQFLYGQAYVGFGALLLALMMVLGPFSPLNDVSQGILACAESIAFVLLLPALIWAVAYKSLKRWEQAKYVVMGVVILIDLATIAMMLFPLTKTTIIN